MSIQLINSTFRQLTFVLLVPILLLSCGGCGGVKDKIGSTEKLQKRKKRIPKEKIRINLEIQLILILELIKLLTRIK